MVTPKRPPTATIYVRWVICSLIKDPEEPPIMPPARSRAGRCSICRQAIWIMPAAWALAKLGPLHLACPLCAGEAVRRLRAQMIMVQN